MLPIRADISSRTFPVITLLLILANTAAFLYQLTLPHEANYKLIMSAGAIPGHIFSGTAPDGGLPAYITPFTSLFLHGGFIHLAGNMLFLWIFGGGVEDRMGHIPFGFFYLVCGAAATLTHVWYNPDSAAPLIGASGAVSGVLGAYILLFPTARIRVLVFLIIFVTTLKIPAVVFIGGWAVLQFINISRGNPQIAWYAHVGGFGAGIIITGIGYMRGRKHE